MTVSIFGRYVLWRMLMLVGVAGMLLAAASTSFAAIAPIPSVAAPADVIPQDDPDLGPQPGEVFRQFNANYSSANYLASLCKSSNSADCTVASTAGRQIPNVDLANATRGELAIEYWGGHINTYDQQYNVNGTSAAPNWQPLPEPVGIPSGSAARCHYRTLTNAIVPVALSGTGGLKSGVNSVGFGIDDQKTTPECEAYSSGSWGQMWVYGATARVYYTPGAVDHPTGSITNPTGGTIGENPTITVSATAPAGRTIASIDLIGNYYDFDRDGDGVFQEWQYALRRGVWEGTIGSRTYSAASVTDSFTWDASWIPDQSQPIKFMARITDSAGVSTMTTAVSVNFNRSGSVKMYGTSHNFYGTWVDGAPRNFGAYNMASRSKAKTATISIPTLSGASNARIVVPTWSGDPTGESAGANASTEVSLNDTLIWNDTPTNGHTDKIGVFHNYKIDTKDFRDHFEPDLIVADVLRVGDNTFKIWSNRANHALEVNWPGPVVLVRYSGAANFSGPTANNLNTTTAEDTAKSLTVSVTNPTGAHLSYSITDTPDHGTVTGEAPNYLYTPAADYNGTDSFSYRVSDQYGNNSTGVVSINVTPVNDAPIINLGSNLAINEGNPLSISGSFTDLDSGGWTATVDYGTGDGEEALTLNGDKTFSLSKTSLPAGSYTITVRISDGSAIATSSVSVIVVGVGSNPPRLNWWNSAWRFRTGISLSSGSFPRLDRVAELPINFTQQLNAISQSGPLIIESIRVLEIDANNTVIDSNVPYEFTPDTDYNASTKASGTLSVLMKGTTAANTTRRYHVYYDTSGTFTAPNFAKNVEITQRLLENYQREPTMVIETRDSATTGVGSRNSSYYYHLRGGGLASILDRQSKDWMSYSTNSMSTGEYRGLPNIGPVYHPGYLNVYSSGNGNTGGSNQRSTTTVVHEGPLKVTLRSVSSNGQWIAEWDFFPRTVRMRIIATPAGSKYWWLYEGTPGGSIKQSDYLVRADHSAQQFDLAGSTSTTFAHDLPGSEWVYLRDGNNGTGGRAIFLANHNDLDTNIDSFRAQQDGSSTTDKMTVFGFGRQDNTAYLQGQNTFSFGLLESASAGYDATYAKTVEGSYRDIPYSIGTTQLINANFTPVAVAESYVTLVNQAINTAAPGVLANDSDGDTDPLSAVLVANPTKGTLTLNANGSFVYTPNTGYVGTDSFSYKASDGIAESTPVVVSIEVRRTNVAPTVSAGSYGVDMNQVLTVAIPGVLTGASDGDGDPISAVVVTGPSHGTLTLNTDGSFVYTPDPGYIGADSFTFKATDGVADSNTATISINVRTVNTPPVAQNSAYQTGANQKLQVPAPGVLTGASDDDGDTIYAALVNGPSHGALTLNADGSFVYTPNTGYVGSDSFTFKATDGTDESATATVSISVRLGRIYIPIAIR